MQLERSPQLGDSEVQKLSSAGSKEAREACRRSFLRSTYRIARTVGGLRGIQRLDLKSNDLAALPSSIGKLTSLKVL